jgi:hypothetical protein
MGRERLFPRGGIESPRQRCLVVTVLDSKGKASILELTMAAASHTKAKTKVNSWLGCLYRASVFGTTDFETKKSEIRPYEKCAPLRAYVELPAVDGR